MTQYLSKDWSYYDSDKKQGRTRILVTSSIKPSNCNPRFIFVLQNSLNMYKNSITNIYYPRVLEPINSYREERYPT